MKKIWIAFLLVACAGAGWIAPDDFIYTPIQTNGYQIATWQKISNPKNKTIHIYIEGDGNSYDSFGYPSSDPTPHGNMMRDLATRDNFENVVYMARPCQFIMDESCSITDWTDGRFSKRIMDSMSVAVKQIAKNKNIVLIGYSGGAMVSGLIIKRNPDIKVDKWITVAGVLNHEKWTTYFDDLPLYKSLDMNTLPKVPQTHFVGGQDSVVPYDLAKTWADADSIELIPNATHDDFGDLKIFD